ncbi:hypothetical protein AAL_05710 [Moelleriella libera RCEF 2490]|uniref:Uncharacterized protein n=1 Tax=Moelleriella libera RCEF 2490 TaxID=1081109 RepID=A0A168A0R3_9HYPO|nr:hypothetical protein AAL_05710 [Moelleriella libera RCEF 2490]
MPPPSTGKDRVEEEEEDEDEEEEEEDEDEEDEEEEAGRKSRRLVPHGRRGGRG